MAFPTSPTINQKHEDYIWDGVAWVENNKEFESISSTATPSFSGWGLSSHTTYGHTVYVPVNISHDLTNSFDSSSGEFTATIEGRYLCTWYGLVYSNYDSLGHAHTTFYVNDVQKSQRNHSMYNISRKYEPLSNTAIVYANVGDKITCKLYTGSGTTIYGPYYNSLGICYIG